MKTYITNSGEQTKKLAAKLAQKFSGGVVALVGELGAGKTTFVQGFAKGLGIKDKIISPTFVLIRQHHIPKTRRILYHIDLYRLEGQNQVVQIGIKELISDPQNIILIEWAEKIKKLLPRKTQWIYFETLDEDKRKIMVD